MNSPSPNSQSVKGSGVSQMNGDFISVGEALKIIPPFKGDKRDVLAFIGNVDTAFTVINPEQEAILYKFVLTRLVASLEQQLVTETWITGQNSRNFCGIHT